MTLLFFATVMSFLVTWLYIRDRRYRMKSLKDAVSRDARRHLNLPTDDAGFAQALLNKHDDKSTLSRKLLEEQNTDRSARPASRMKY